MKEKEEKRRMKERREKMKKKVMENMSQYIVDQRHLE